jgi:hypothetical protein
VYHLHPEFGLLCPSRRVRRTARVALALLACSVIVGTLAVNPGPDGTLIIAHDDVAATNADTVQTVAQGTATTIAESAPAPEGSAHACKEDPSSQRCSVGRARRPLSPRAANEAPMIAALPLGRTTAPVPVSPAAPLNSADAASTIISTPAVGDPDETPAPAAKKVRKPSRKNGGHGVSRDRRWRDDQWSARAYALPDNRYLRSPYEWSWGRSW